ncbi:MAG: hypothetical protein RIQ60_3815 [Pseudomonadota bacterium]|jgi:hypothetical protein
MSPRRVWRPAPVRLVPTGALTLLPLLPLLAQGAAYQPGTATPVEVAPADATPTTGSADGLRWTLAPVRSGGTLAFDLRTLRLSDGSRSSQALVYNDIDLSSHLWQPWFAQVRAGLGLLAERDRRSAPEQPDTRSGTGSVTGRFALAVFPASRFPFELRADLSDSRVSGDNLGTDFRSQRLGLTQSWRPAYGNQNLQLNIEHSRLSSAAGVDSVNLAQLSSFRQDGPHSLEFNAALTRNQRDDAAPTATLAAGAGTTIAASDLATTLGTLGLRHGWRRDAGLSVDTLASWNTLELGHRQGGSGRSGQAGSFALTRLGERLGLDRVDAEQTSELRQLATYATWRPGADSLFQPASPLVLSATLRWADSGLASAAGSDANGQPLPAVEHHVRSLFGTVGASQELGREWRLAGALAGGLVQPDNAAGRLTRNANLALSWLPAPQLLADDWRYRRTATLSATAGDVRQRDTEAGLAAAASSSNPGNATPSGADSADQQPGMRRTLGLQLEHGVSRSLPLDGGRGSLAWTLTQGLGALRASPSADDARALAHGASVYWQSSPASAMGALQSYAALSLSDARAWAPQASRFQLVNLQFSQRQQLARHASWNGDLTLQASRTDVSQLDAFTGESRSASVSWQRYGNGTLSYENQRFMDVARLRYSALLGLHTEQLERRSLGDVNAQRERVSQSIENRLDYSIGRLDARLALRHARVDGRDVTALQARLQRRY